MKKSLFSFGFFFVYPFLTFVNFFRLTFGDIFKARPFLSQLYLKQLVQLFIMTLALETAGVKNT